MSSLWGTKLKGSTLVNMPSLLGAMAAHCCVANKGKGPSALCISPLDGLQNNTSYAYQDFYNKLMHSISRIFFLPLISFLHSPPWRIQDHVEYEYITVIIVYANPGLLHCHWLGHCAQMLLLGVFLKWMCCLAEGPSALSLPFPPPLKRIILKEMEEIWMCEGRKGSGGDGPFSAVLSWKDIRLLTYRWGCPLLPIICLATIIHLLLNQKEPLANKLLLFYFSNLFCHLVEAG